MRFLGIDLGTTNCGFASTSADAEAQVELFAIPQLTNPGEVQAEPLLESALYLAREGEFAEGALDLPWLDGNRTITGRLAARRGVETLGRLVTSAKSWLSYTGADRTAAILPVNAPEGAPRVSPVEASQRYLEHMKAAWDYEHPDEPFVDQSVVLTVPASFDEVARQLTQKAAEQAGYRNLILLEEPQAAFYAWLERHEDWRESVQPGDLILVIDVGGGTTDFTLISVTEGAGALQLERVAVGDHLLLGGDNMDLALAHSAAARMGKLDAMQFHTLWQQCRLAKENLLSNDELQEAPLTILGRGSSLIGGTIKGKLTRTEVETLLVDGFFPVVTSHDMPARQRRSGLMEVGLPYEPDAAITRHLARFLRRDASGMACPTHVLFNGGVFRAGHLRERVVEVLNAFLAEEGKPPVIALEGDDLMHAVARGAAYYGRARQGRGIRIRGGVPRTYYIGIESAMPAVPGFAAPMKALTVVPFGMEEGTGTTVPNREFALVVGEPAEFRFFSSSARKHDEAGTLLEEIDSDLEEIAPIQVHLEGQEGQMVRVSLETHVTETGVLELWCVARDGRRWKLEFQVREAGQKRKP
ncbi:Hsp70 family protein [Paludibaculum fermentans]|uniref:Hsp70 family protein n=1 Tax=Paludibaculum fermentans TaxID=1473598 RepID=UPI003EB80AA9